MTKAGERLINAAQSALDEFRRKGGKPLEQMEAEMTDTPNKIEEIRAALGWWNDGDPHPLEFLAPDMARIVLAAGEALEAIDTYTKTPTDRGGKSGPKGKARDARDAAIDRLRKALEGLE